MAKTKTNQFALKATADFPSNRGLNCPKRSSKMTQIQRVDFKVEKEYNLSKTT